VVVVVSTGGGGGEPRLRETKIKEKQKSCTKKRERK
jgi:hypothetical protein